MERTANNSSDYLHSFACSYQEDACSQSYMYNPTLFRHTVVNIVLSVFLALAAVLGNGLVFAAYYFSESLRSPAHTVLMSLAATDFLSGLLSQPLFIMQKIIIVTGSCTKIVCIVTNLLRLFMIFLTGATLLNLSLTTLDRYIAVCHTYKYPELVTDSRVKKLLVTMWLFWAVIAFGGRALVGLPATASFLFVISPNVIFIIALYVMIFREIRRIEANPDNSIGNNSEEERTTKRERKSIKTLALILGLVIFCFFPMIVYVILKQNFFVTSPIARAVVLQYASNAAFSNSSLNVLVYYWGNEEMRRAMQKVVRKIRQRFHNDISP